MIKCAHLYSDMNNYEKAVLMYEEGAKWCLEKNVNKHAVKDYLSRGLLCKLWLSIIKYDNTMIVENAYENYQKIIPSFAHTPISELIQNIIKTFKYNDPEKFSTLCRNYENQYKMDIWTAQLLLQIKNNIEKEGIYKN